MKRVLFISSLLTCTTLFIGTLYSTDETQCTVMAYDDARDHEEALALVMSHLSEFVSPNKADLDAEKFSKKYSTALNTNSHISSLYKPIENTFTRLVLRDKEKLVGISDFYLTKEDCDAVEKNDGYIETMVFKRIDIEKCLLLSRKVLSQLHTLNAQRAIIHFRADKLGAQSPYWPMVHADPRSTLKDETHFETMNGIVRLEIPFQN